MDTDDRLTTFPIAFTYAHGTAMYEIPAHSLAEARAEALRRAGLTEDEVTWIEAS